MRPGRAESVVSVVLQVHQERLCRLCRSKIWDERTYERGRIPKKERSIHDSACGPEHIHVWGASIGDLTEAHDGPLR